MVILFVLLFVVVVFLSIGRRRRNPDPLYRPVSYPIAGRQKADTQMTPMGIIDTQEAYLEKTIRKDVLPDTAIRRTIYNIVNGDESLVEAENRLEKLSTMVRDIHGAGSPMIELIRDERIHLRYPDWTGSHGDFRSVKQ